jgi:hypothetical protein
MRTSQLAVPALLALAACARAPLGIDGGLRASERESLVNASAAAASTAQDEPKKQDAPKEEEKKGRPILTTVILYLPNRVVDLFDIARAGVEVGPGIGIDLTATEAASVAFMSRTSVGIGYETLRHLPFKMGGEFYAGVGPIQPGIGGENWYRNFWDLRVELHVLLVGAHVAVNPGEIVDFIVGIFTFDPMHDDF